MGFLYKAMTYNGLPSRYVGFIDQNVCVSKPKPGAVHTSGNRMFCFLCTDHSFWSSGELINYAILLGTGITKGIGRGPVLTELKSSHGRSEQSGLP